MRQYEHPGINAVLVKFLHESSLPQLPIPGVSTSRTKDERPAQYSPFECNELVIKLHNRTGERSGSEHQESETGDAVEVSANSESEGNAVEVEARLGNALPTLIQYYTSIDRSLDRAVNRLETLQQLRRKTADHQ